MEKERMNEWEKGTSLSPFCFLRHHRTASPKESCAKALVRCEGGVSQPRDSLDQSFDLLGPDLTGELVVTRRWLPLILLVWMGMTPGGE